MNMMKTMFGKGKSKGKQGNAGSKKGKGKGKGKGKAAVAGDAGGVSKLISLCDSRRGNSMLRGPLIDFHHTFHKLPHDLPANTTLPQP